MQLTIFMILYNLVDLIIYIFCRISSYFVILRILLISRILNTSQINYKNILYFRKTVFFFTNLSLISFFIFKTFQIFSFHYFMLLRIQFYVLKLLKNSLVFIAVDLPESHLAVRILYPPHEISIYGSQHKRHIVIISDNPLFNCFDRSWSTLINTF